jgi:hypothetical protein
LNTFRVALIVFAGLAYAQDGTGSADRKQPLEKKDDSAGTILVRRLESVSWNPVRAELTWLVSVWDVSVSIEQPVSREKYVIHLDDALMEFQGETRSFDSTEAKHVRSLMDVISTYAVESTVWWDYGEGAKPDSQQPSKPPDGGKSPAKPDGKTDPKDTKPKVAPVRGPVANLPASQSGEAAASGVVHP